MSDISVTIVAATNVSASITNDAGVNVAIGSGFGSGGATALLVEAGANITVTTAQGSFTVIGRNVPVQSVNGRTGTVVLTAADIAGITAVTGVTSVNGKQGAVALVATDLTAAAAVHSHVAADITNLTAVANVVSVNGITGSPAIVAGSNITLTTSGSSIIISASGGGGTTGGSVASVNGNVGTVVLSSVDVSAASASHSHVAANISNLTSVANVVSVNGRTGVVSLVATDVTAASATHSHSYVTSLNSNTGGLSIVAGDNVTVTTSGSSIIVTGASGGAQGPPGSFGDPQTISQKTASYTLQLADVGTLLALNGASTATPIVVTVPSSTSVSWIAGSHIDVARLGTAAVSMVPASGVTVTATPSSSLRDKGSGGSLVYLGSDSWLLVGDLA